jgi:hypothetical protein
MGKLVVGLKVFIALMCLIIIGCCNPGPAGRLAVTLYPQETEMWCWAGSGQMVMHYLGTDVDQCVQANNRFGRKDCCNINLCPPPTEPDTHPCVTGGWAEYGRYGFSFQNTTNAALSWVDVKAELSSNSYCGNTPFTFTWHWLGGGGHTMVATGYISLTEGRFIEIMDPWSPCVGDVRAITYDYYVASPGHHTHWDDYYKIRATGGS